jgi:hypothetical protein
MVENEKSIKELKKEDPRYSEKKKKLREAIGVLTQVKQARSYTETYTIIYRRIRSP